MNTKGNTIWLKHMRLYQAEVSNEHASNPIQDLTQTITGMMKSVPILIRITDFL